jgi:hypothetical protein
MSSLWGIWEAGSRLGSKVVDLFVTAACTRHGVGLAVPRGAACM